MSVTLEGLRRGYILARNKIRPPQAKLAALELGKVLRQREEFNERLNRLMSKLKECPWYDTVEQSVLKRAIKNARATGRRARTGRSGKIFTPVGLDLLEPKILKPDVSDARNREEIKERYGEDIFYFGNWEETPDGGLYMKVFDIAEDVREAVVRIAGDFDVHFISSHYTSGSEGHFIDCFTQPASMDPEKFGCGGYCGHAVVSFADDRQILVDEFKHFCSQPIESRRKIKTGGLAS